MSDDVIPTTGGKSRIAGYVLSGLAIAFMIFDGGIKLVPIQAVTDSMLEYGFPTGDGFARGLGSLLLVCTALYAYRRTSVLGAILLTAYLGGAVVTQLRAGTPLFSHLLFGVYLGLFVWGGLYLRDDRIRALIPLATASR
ncbi:DoxX family protein [Methylocystis parvus]|uniref:DoxX family protein n=1 Tax=Methylocystis parvus TaxID=134 RepID=UPI003C78FD37